MKKLIITLGIATMMAACDGAGSGTASLESNPLVVGSSLEFGAPEFDKIKPEHYLPAFHEGMRRHNEEVEAIIANTEAPTFQNVIVALERAGQLLGSVSRIFYGISGVDGTDEIRQIEAEVGPLLSAHSDAISMNSKLFDKVRTVYEQEYESLQGEDKRLLEVVYRSFVRQGALLADQDKQRLKDINSKLATLTNDFNNKATDAARAATILVDNVEELEGLSEASLATAAQDAKAAGHEGKWLLKNSNTTRADYLMELKNRSLRQRLLESSLRRAEQGDTNDTNAIVREIMRLRAQKAQILGYEHYAAWGLEEQMAKDAQTVRTFLGQLASAYRPKAEADAAQLQEYAQQVEGKDFKLEAWDWDYYAEKLRKERYDLDENDLKPYFALDSVLNNGVFYMAKELYGISFQERSDLPVYAEGVKVYDVLDKDGSKIAIFYTDFYRRDTKRGGAWMSSWVKQNRLTGARPVIYNVCNYAPPVDGKPSLLNMDEITTLFHEFGHGLHGMLSDLNYATLSGTSVSRDFVEMPSQFHEHWATDPAVLSRYAKHYQTGEAMPTELINKMKAASKFNQAYALGETLSSAIIDLAWHTTTTSTETKSVPDFERSALAEYGMLNDRIPPRYRTSYFRHIMGGYAAGYYAYLWAEVLDNNVYDWFVANGGLKAENGQRFRDLILSQGNGRPSDELFREMTGLEQPNVQSLMKARGLQ